MKRLDIDKYGIEFKNLLSGPAPVGRILKYINLAGDKELWHQNGFRYTNLTNNIGSAWTTEFMIGLGLVAKGEVFDKREKLHLTNNGKKIYNVLKGGKSIDFTEKSEEIVKIRSQIKECSDELFNTFKIVFVASFPFIILKQFLDKYGYVYNDKKRFMDDFFEGVKNIYDPYSKPYNRDAITTTGQNRVPSILQLCELFYFLDEDDKKYAFNKVNIEKAMSNEGNTYSPEKLVKAAKKVELIIKKSKEIVEKYGENGNVFVEAIVRNSELQKMFKNNLMVSQKAKCIMCGAAIPELLIGSHIKPAAISNAIEKADHNNGLLLCCNHDKLFDRYLITFNFFDGAIELSKKLSEDDIKILNIDKNYKLPEDLLTPKRMEYLQDHNMEFQKREDER